MRGRPKSSGSSSRVRFSGSERGAAHQSWYAAIADNYGMLYESGRDERAAEFLHGVFRRRGPVHDVLDVACGTFGIDLRLVKLGYRVVGRDLSPAMIRVARRNLRTKGLRADLAVGDMRALRLGREFDAVVCLGTAFNYLVSTADIERALRMFHNHVRRGGLLVLDLTNFATFIDSPMNARTEVDHTATDGRRIAIFAFNEQNQAKTIHIARFFTVTQREGRIDLRFDEASLKVWRKEAIRRLLRRRGFRPVEWWGDLRRNVRYRPSRSPRLVSVAVRR